jgi:hypothetical protein
MVLIDFFGRISLVGLDFRHSTPGGSSCFSTQSLSLTIREPPVDGLLGNGSIISTPLLWIAFFVLRLFRSWIFIMAREPSTGWIFDSLSYYWLCVHHPRELKSSNGTPMSLHRIFESTMQHYGTSPQQRKVISRRYSTCRSHCGHKESRNMVI